MTPRQTFLKGFLIGLSAFILLNLLAAHLFSDCGLPALFGLAACSDAISRAGFPFIFFEQGGFAYRSIFNFPIFILDLVIGLGMAIVIGLIMSNRKNK